MLSVALDDKMEKYLRAQFTNAIFFRFAVNFFGDCGMEELVHVPPFILTGGCTSTLCLDVHVSK
jgi:hypothetical protein